jgi:hypothetical protein
MKSALSLLKNSALDRGEQSTSGSGRFTDKGKAPGLCEDAVWFPETSWNFSSQLSPDWFGAHPASIQRRGKNKWFSTSTSPIRLRFVLLTN